MVHTLKSEFELPLELEEVFPFFSCAENLERITPRELGFRIVTPGPVEIREGALIEYQLSLFGIPFGWQTRITKFQPPTMFIDEQLAGPYKMWIHTHTFEATESGTMIRDEVQYSLPLFPFGEAAYPIIRLQLQRIFAYRRRAVTKALMVGRRS